MRLLVYRFGSVSGRRMVGVTSPANDGTCWSLWMGEFGTVEALGHDNSEVCDEHVLEHLGALAAEGWAPEARPVVMEAIDPPPVITDAGYGREHIDWAKYVLTAAATMFATLKTTAPSPCLQEMTIEFTVIEPDPEILKMIYGGFV